MFLPATFSIALLMMLASMICWGSWANAYKLTRGDAFIGSLAVFLAEDLPEDEALARASLYAALSTTNVGTQKAFVSRQSFEGEWSRRAIG